MRDVAAHKTILSVILVRPATDTDNTYHVVTGATNATIDGFYRYLGNANGATSDTTSGAVCTTREPNGSRIACKKS